MRRHTAAIVAAVLAAGCAAPASPQPHAEPVSLAAKLDPLADSPAARPGKTTHGLPGQGGGRLATPHPKGRRGPEAGDADRGAQALAADEIAWRLADEELIVLDLQTDLEQTHPRRTVVVVAVIFGTGRSHPHHARYRVDLVPGDGGWAVDEVEAAP